MMSNSANMFPYSLSLVQSYSSSHVSDITRSDTSESESDDSPGLFNRPAFGGMVLDSQLYPCFSLGHFYVLLYEVYYWADDYRFVKQMAHLDPNRSFRARGKGSRFEWH